MIEVFGDRQTGKTHTIMLASLWRAAIEGSTVLWTSNTLRHAKNTLLSTETQVALSQIVHDRVRFSPYMRITFPSGGQVAFLSRHGYALRGFTADYLVFDEYTPKDEDVLISACVRLLEGDVQHRVTVIARADD